MSEWQDNMLVWRLRDGENYSRPGVRGDAVPVHVSTTRHHQDQPREAGEFFRFYASGKILMVVSGCLPSFLPLARCVLQ